MSFFSSNLCPKRFLLSSMLIGILSLGACQKADIIPQPAAPNTTTSAVAQPTFNAESFSTNGITIVDGPAYIKPAKPQPVEVACKSAVI